MMTVTTTTSVTAKGRDDSDDARLVLAAATVQSRAQQVMVDLSTLYDRMCAFKSSLATLRPAPLNALATQLLLFGQTHDQLTASQGSLITDIDKQLDSLEKRKAKARNHPSEEIDAALAEEAAATGADRAAIAVREDFRSNTDTCSRLLHGLRSLRQQMTEKTQACALLSGLIQRQRNNGGYPVEGFWAGVYAIKDSAWSVPVYFGSQAHQTDKLAAPTALFTQNNDLARMLVVTLGSLSAREFIEPNVDSHCPALARNGGEFVKRLKRFPSGTNIHMTLDTKTLNESLGKQPAEVRLAACADQFVRQDVRINGQALSFHTRGINQIGDAEQRIGMVIHALSREFPGLVKAPHGDAAMQFELCSNLCVPMIHALDRVASLWLASTGTEVRCNTKGIFNLTRHATGGLFYAMSYPDTAEDQVVVKRGDEVIVRARGSVSWHPGSHWLHVSLWDIKCLETGDTGGASSATGKQKADDDAASMKTATGSDEDDDV